MIFASTLDLNTLNGRNGLLFQGAASEPSSNTIRIIGDINGDGLDDVAIGSAKATVGSMQNAGQVYVIFGSSSGFSAQMLQANLNGKNGFVINGLAEGDGLGFAVSGAGDVNGDGIADLMVSANNAVNGAGRVYVIFGQIVKFDGDFPNPFDLNNLNGGNGFAVNGINAGDKLGFSVGSLGDITGDKISDIIIGATGASDKAGSAYVIFGNTTSTHRPLKLFPHPFDLTSLNGNNGFAIRGLVAQDELGSSVDGAGDLNNDGKLDILVGAYSADSDNLLMAGKVYAVFGANSYPSEIDLNSLDGSNGFVVNGIKELGYLGCSVSKAGDFNGDGKDDVILGAQNAAYNGLESAGQTYVIFGNKTFSNTFDLNFLDGRNGFTVSGLETNEHLGYSLSYAGDINKDNKADILIGAYGATSTVGNFNNAGKVYIIFGQSSTALNYFDLNSINGANGFVIEGTYSGLYLGNSVSGGGDIDGDSMADMIIGSARNPSVISDTFVIFNQELKVPSIAPAPVPSQASHYLPAPKESFISTPEPKTASVQPVPSSDTLTNPVYDHLPAPQNTPVHTDNLVPTPSVNHIGSTDNKPSHMSSLDASLISGAVLTGLAITAGVIGAAIFMKSKHKIKWNFWKSDHNTYRALPEPSSGVPMGDISPSMPLDAIVKFGLKSSLLGDHADTAS